MFASRKKLLLGLAGVATAAALVVGGGVAGAVLTGTTGTYIERQSAVTQNVPYINSSAAGTWQPVPGMSRSFTIATSTRRAFEVSYSAESQCVGTSGYCSVRVVMVSPSGLVTELNPANGTDFAFDSAVTSSVQWRALAFNRSSAYQAAGTYTLRVEATKVGAGVSRLRLDEQHFKVGVLRP